MKRLVVLAALVLAGGLNAQQLSLAEARAKIGLAINDPTVMATIVQQLSAADQKEFVSDVNEALAKMPGSAEAKAANALDANRAALKGAQKGTVTDMLAEVFATAPLETLTVINEQFASDLFNRDANPAVTYTDEQFVKLAKDALVKMAARLEKADEGNQRLGFAILMFVRASNGSPKNLAETLVSVMPESAREIATKEWFPAALAEGDAKSYEPMLAAIDNPIPNGPVVLRLCQLQSLEAMLADLAADDKKGNYMKQINALTYATGRGGTSSGLDNGLYRLPFNYSRDVIGTDLGQKGVGRKIGDGSKKIEGGGGSGGGSGGGTGGGGGVPGGVPVGPGGKPSGRGGVDIEPGGYNYETGTYND